jgi:hypothetical protein
MLGFYAFEDFREDGTSVIKGYTEKEAIEYQKGVAAKVKPDFKYDSDQHALEDFIAVNWAWWVDLLP